MDAEYFHFLRPLWFLALLPAAILFGLLWQGQKLVGRWKDIIAPHLLPHLMEGEATTQKRFALTGILLLWILAAIALAGPVWTRLPEPVEQTTSPLIICWDLSPSMLAEDVKPSRLVRSRLKIVDLLKARQEGLTALIAYSGEAYVVTPLTDDNETIINLLPALSPTTLPSQGSNPEMAFEKATELLNNARALRGDILFITDEITRDAQNVLRERLSGQAHQLTIWGVGTEAGGPIPLPQGGFAKKGDSIAVVKLNERELQQFTAQTRSFYVPMVATNNDVETIEQLLNIDFEASKKSERIFDQWFEHGQYLVYLLLPFVLILFRRGWLMSFIFIIPLSYSPQSHALDWQSLWKTKDQQAKALMEAGDYETASQTFEDQRWQAAAQYKAKQFTEAAENFAKPGTLNASDLYNQANALTFAGEYDEAIARYDEALKMQSNFSEAKENRAIAEKLKAIQEQQQNQQQQQSDQNQENSDQEQSNEQQQSQQQSEQQQSEQSQSEQDQSSEQQSQQAQQDEQSEDEQQSAQEKSDEEKTEEEKEAMAKQEKKESQEQKVQQLAQLQEGEEPQTEEQQKLEQWLRKVPDDPSGLLRKKFWHEHKMRQRDSSRPNAQRQKQKAEQRW